MEEQKFLIPIDEPLAEFKNHIEPEYNKRIIFSAPFGTGKTYFLDQYFNHHEKDEYNSFFLYPVNYSVSSNEDVFELIKFDILLQLLENTELKLEEIDFTEFFIAQSFLFNKADDLVKWMLNRLGKIGKGLAKANNVLQKIVTDYKEFRVKSKQNISLVQSLEFVNQITTKKGTPYEQDAVTNLICLLLEELEENQKPSALIIDDLDRIDPEHIFRLLNVFAAHFDIGGANTNKFGFEKVILVCDISNIRNVFHAKYGIKTDFTGYIDKFYSVDIFYFTNEIKILEYIDRKIIISFYQKSFNDRSLLSVSVKDINFRELLVYTWQTLYKYNALNIRSLKRIFEQKLVLPTYEINFKGYEYKIHNYQSFIVILFDILKFNYGNYALTLQALEKTSAHTETVTNDKTSYPNLNQYYGHILAIITHNHHFEKNNDTSTTYNNDNLGITFNVEKPMLSGGIFYSATTGPLSQDNYNQNKQQVNRLKKMNFFSLLVEAFKTLQSIGHLKD